VAVELGVLDTDGVKEGVLLLLLVALELPVREGEPDTEDDELAEAVAVPVGDPDSEPEPVAEGVTEEVWEGEPETEPEPVAEGVTEEVWEGEPETEPEPEALVEGLNVAEGVME
jgi:hypothetical protein